jgi:hypothetical protein
MVTAASSATRRAVRPYCRALARGVIAIDGRSKEGKFLRRCEAELTAHVGGSPSFAQKLLIRRAARAMLRLELLDAKMASGNWTDHDARTFGGLNNAIRLALRELGVRETKPKKPIPTIAEIAARHRSEGASGRSSQYEQLSAIRTCSAGSSPEKAGRRGESCL